MLVLLPSLLSLSLSLSLWLSLMYVSLWLPMLLLCRRGCSFVVATVLLYNVFCRPPCCSGWREMWSWKCHTSRTLTQSPRLATLISARYPMPWRSSSTTPFRYALVYWQYIIVTVVGADRGTNAIGQYGQHCYIIISIISVAFDYSCHFFTTGIVFETTPPPLLVGDQPEHGPARGGGGGGAWRARCELPRHPGQRQRDECLWPQRLRHVLPHPGRRAGLWMGGGGG